MTTSLFHQYLTNPLTIGRLQLPNRLIQGPLAGFSCAPFRQLVNYFTPPAYCVSEMISAHDVVYKHTMDNRYLYRAADEHHLCYQIAGNNPDLMAQAAKILQAQADLIDINCGCPKGKIRKKGAGSALLEQPEVLFTVVNRVRLALDCPLTVKIRLQGKQRNVFIAQKLADLGVDALIIHGRRWTDDYATPCDLNEIAAIKQAVSIPVIVNGDIADSASLWQAFNQTGCDGFMISRAGTGKPWLFHDLLNNSATTVDNRQQIGLFMTHLYGLARLESEHQAVLQSKSLVRYYFRERLADALLPAFYQLTSLQGIELFLLNA